MQQALFWPRNRRNSRVLRASSAKDRSGGPFLQQEDAAPKTCRVCWGEASSEEGEELVAPCSCSGTMKYVHKSCLSQWQCQLRQVKGAYTARRCDICKTQWKPEYREEESRLASNSFSNLVQLFVNGASAVQPHILTVYRWWRTVALAQGFLHALEAGALGFRLGLQYRSIALPHVPVRRGESLAHWAPFSVWAASSIPPMQLPVFFAMYFAASTSEALQQVIFAAAGLYAGALSGFAHGTVHTMLQTLKLIGGASDMVAYCARGVLRFVGALYDAFVRPML